MDYSVFELTMLVCTPFIFFMALEIGYWLIGKIIDFAHDYKAFKEYKRARDYWYDYDLTPEEYFQEKGI